MTTRRACARKQQHSSWWPRSYASRMADRGRRAGCRRGALTSIAVTCSRSRSGTSPCSPACTRSTSPARSVGTWAPLRASTSGDSGSRPRAKSWRRPRSRSPRSRSRADSRARPTSRGPSTGRSACHPASIAAATGVGRADRERVHPAQAGCARERRSSRAAVSLVARPAMGAPGASSMPCPVRSCIPLALIVLACGSAPPAPVDPATRAIDAYCKPLVARGDLSGQLMVLRNGRPVIERSFGSANVELGVAVTPDTRFNIASVTKPMTSVITIQLIDAKRIGLHDSIARWLPGFSKGDSIRIEHLLRHASGIPHEVVPDSEMTRPYSAAQVVERAKRMALDFSPGSRSSYSSGGFEVLARILELAGGKSYGELLEDRILRPLGMSHTVHGDSRTLMPGRATGYVPGPR